MRLPRRVTGTVTAGLLGLAPLAVVPTASAAATVATFTVASPSDTVLDYGETLDVAVDVDSQDGLSPSGGTTTLYARSAAATTWTAVGTTTSPGSSFLGVRPQMNTTYKVVYAGFTPPDADRGDRYAGSESLEFSVTVARRITHPNAGFVLKGKVTPQYARKKVLVRASRTKGSSYKLVKAVRTDTRGKYKYTLPKRSGTWYWLISVKGDTRFRATSYTYETRVF